MTTKTLNITEDAYHLLKARKRPEESFTDVILRLASDRPLSSIVGALSARQGAALESAVRVGRKRSRARRERQSREIARGR